MRLWHGYLVAAALLLVGVMALNVLRAPECRAPKNELDSALCAGL